MAKTFRSEAPDRARAARALRIEGFEPADIARLLGVSENSVYRYLRDGRSTEGARAATRTPTRASRRSA